MPDRRSFLSSSAAAFAGIFLSGKTSLPQSTRHLVFTGGNWFDGRGFSRHTFYSRAGILTSRKPAGAIETIDLKNWFIVPPFGEAHNHNVDFSSEEQWAGIKQMYLRDGIFYAKNPMNLKRAATPLAGRINIPSSLDVVFAHAGLTVTDGHPMGLIKRNIERGGMLPSDIDGGFAWLIDTQDDLDKKWPRIIAEKPDFIKTILVYSEEYEKRRNDPKYFSWKGLNPALLPDIARRAHRTGLRVSTHVESATDFHHAVIAGVDEINHLPGFRPENNDFAKGYANLDRYRITEEDVRMAAQRKISVVTTIGTSVEMSFKEQSALGTNVRKMLSDNLQLLHGHGVKIAIGSDSFRQTSQPEALAIHHLGAFDNLTLLKLWCENTAWTIFPRRKIGHLKDGYEASFLALRDDPLKDFTNVKQIEMRVKQGTMLSAQ